MRRGGGRELDRQTAIHHPSAMECRHPLVDCGLCPRLCLRSCVPPPVPRVPPLIPPLVPPLLPPLVAPSRGSSATRCHTLRPKSLTPNPKAQTTSHARDGGFCFGPGGLCQKVFSSGVRLFRPHCPVRRGPEGPEDLGSRGGARRARSFEGFAFLSGPASAGPEVRATAR